jgi:DNA-binding NtrC family response regulator
MKKIFLVEDSALVAELLKFELENEFDCSVVWLKNGCELIKRMHEKPSLIILDYFIDGEDQENGFDIMKEIKEMNNKLPVIIFSGQQSMQRAIEILDAGAIDYIDKNEDNFLDELIHSVENVFRFGESKKE